MNSFSESVQKCTSRLCLKYIITYNRFCIQTKIQIRTIRKQNTIFNTICGLFENIWELFVFAFTQLTHSKIEPSASAWVCVCKYLPAGNGMSALTRDTYLNFDSVELQTLSTNAICKENNDNHVEGLRTINDKLKTAVKHCSPTNINDSGASFDAVETYHIIIAKFSPDATIVKPPKSIDVCSELKNVHLSSVRLLEIEYQCGDLPAITIEIPNSHYVVDNEILSKTYILRHLEHLPMYSNWIFRENDYRVKIIDYDSNVFSINYNQYILIEKDEYKIMYNTPLNSRQNASPFSENQVHSITQERTQDPNVYKSVVTSQNVQGLFKEMKHNNKYMRNQNKPFLTQEDETKDYLKTE